VIANLKSGNVKKQPVIDLLSDDEFFNESMIDYEYQREQRKNLNNKIYNFPNKELV